MILLKNGTVADANGERKQDVFLKDGKINLLNANSTETVEIDCTGLVIMPGWIDLHVHCRYPGFEYKEDIASASNAAAAGGVTTIVGMPNTKPVPDNVQVLGDIYLKAEQQSLVNFLQTASITKNQAGAELTDFNALKKANAAFLTDDGYPIANDGVMRNACLFAAKENIVLGLHEEDPTVQFDAGDSDSSKFNAEALRTGRDLEIAKETNAKLHFMHVSSGESVKKIREAKKTNANITAETAPHYFSLTNKAWSEIGTNAKMNPPLKSEADRLEIIAGLRDGTIDCIATDHAPHSIEEKKREFTKALNGVIGLETLVPVTIHYLHHENQFSLKEIARLTSFNPARILGLAKKSLVADGFDADLVIIDVNASRKIDAEEFHSKARNTPWNGFELRGVVKKTIVGGKIVFDGEKTIN